MLASLGLVAISLTAVASSGGSDGSGRHATNKGAAGDRVKPADLFLAPTGSDSAACSRSSPCLTLSRAYQVARPGQIVELAAGTYPSGQSLVYDPAKRQVTPVTFRAAAGADAVVDNLDIVGAQHLAFVGIDFTHDLGMVALNRSDPSSPRAGNVTFRGGRMQTFHFASAHDVTIDGVDIGHYFYSDGFGSNSLYSDDGLVTERNITIENSVFRDIRRARTAAEGAGLHAECLFIKRVDGVTIRDNRFIGCPVYAISMYDQNQPGNAASNILIENNVLSCANDVDGCGGGSSIDISTKGYASISNVTIRFNSSPNGFTFEGTSPLFRNDRAYANVAGGMSCASGGWSVDYNVLAESSCGGTNLRAAPGFVGSAWNGDFHLVRDSRALARVPHAFCLRQGCPRDDADGQQRPRRWRLDAGADQREPASILPNGGIGAARIGVPEAAVDEFYGKPRRFTRRPPFRGGPKLRTASYAVHGGRLWVMYGTTGSVAGVATSSLYYSTSAGLGPGAPAASATSAGFRWSACGRAFRRSFPGTVVLAGAAAGPRAKHLGVVSVVAASVLRGSRCAGG
jgi:Protein of unknown function (DUF1565)